MPNVIGGLGTVRVAGSDGADYVTTTVPAGSPNITAMDVNVVGGISVDFSPGDIQIGAVEIKDHDSNTRLDVVEIQTGQHAMLTREARGSNISVFGSDIISPSVTLDVATRTVPVGQRFIWKGGIIGGNDAGEFIFKVNGSVKHFWRNAGANRSKDLIFPHQLEANAGDTVTVSVKNVGNKIRQFEASISGFDEKI